MMNWSEQADAMMKTWAEAQRQMWSSWGQLTWDSPMPFVSVAEMWHDMTVQMLKSWVEGADPTARDVAEQLFAAQGAMTRFLEMAANVWRSIAPRMEAGEDWQETLAEQLGQVRDQFIEASKESLKSSGSMSELWESYLQQWQFFAQPWLSFVQQGSSRWGQALSGSRTAISELNALYGDTFEQTFGKLLQSPGLGYTRELEEKLKRGFEAWVEFQQLNLDYQTMMADTWVQAFEKLMREVAAMAEQGQSVSGIRDFLNQWSAVGDIVFKEVFRSDQYIRVQGRFLNAAMTYRLRQRDVMEIILKLNDLPTRSEVDEIHQQVYQLRKELKALKKSLAAPQRESLTAETPAPVSERKPTRQAARKASGTKTTEE